MEFFSKFKHWDLTLAVTAFLLLLVGLALIYSTSLNGDRSTFTKQVIFFGIGIVFFVFFAYVDYKALARSVRYFYAVLFLTLIAILRLGQNIQGSRRWFNFKFFHFQPAEFVKIAIILLLARFFAIRRGEIKSWQNILLSFLYVIVPAVFIAREPDLGSAIILVIIWLGILLLSNVQKKVFVYLFLAFAVFSTLSWTYFLHDYQKNRIEIFIDPNLDPRGRGYNVQQAIISVGSGNIFGTGLGRGLQSQLKFLPERQTDFIFAAASEELGFVGAMVILILYFILLYRLIVIYKNCPDDFGRFTIAGIFFMIFGQVVINVGMNMGVLPVTGIPLPFISYGGSSLLTLAMALGISESIAIRSKGLRLK